MRLDSQLLTLLTCLTVLTAAPPRLMASDNGACQEGEVFGSGGEVMVRNPPLETTDGVRIGLQWAEACNTPSRKFKHFVHEVGY